MATFDPLFGTRKEGVSASAAPLMTPVAPAPTTPLFTPAAPVQKKELFPSLASFKPKPVPTISPEQKAAQEYQKSKDYLRSLVDTDTLENGNVDEIVEHVISNARKTAAKEYYSARQAAKHSNLVGGTLLTLDRFSQAGEGVQSAAYDILGSAGDYLGARGNFFQRVTGQQQLALYRQFIEKNAPDRLQDFEQAISQEGYSRGAEITGRALETVVESAAIGSALYRATAAIPAMQKLATFGKIGKALPAGTKLTTAERGARLLYTALQNVAADIGIRSEQAVKYKKSAEEVARGVASSPSILFAFHSVPMIGVGVVADLYAGKLNGLSTADNVLNAAMNLGGNFIDLKSLRVGRMADVAMDDIKAQFKKNFQGPPELAERAWQEAENAYRYAQANPSDLPGVQKHIAEGEKRLLQLKRDFFKAETAAEKRLARFTGKGAETPGVPPEKPRMERLIEKYGSIENIPLSEVYGTTPISKTPIKGGELVTKGGYLYRSMSMEEFNSARATGNLAPSAPEAPGIPGRKYFSSDPELAQQLAAPYGSSEVLIRAKSGDIGGLTADPHAKGGLSAYTEQATPIQKFEVSNDGGKTWKQLTSSEYSTTAKGTQESPQGVPLREANRRYLEGDQSTKTSEDNIDLPRTPYNKRITTVDDYYSPKDVLKRLGMEDRYRQLRTAKNEGRKELNSIQAQIRDWAKAVPTEEGNVRIAKYLDGQIPISQLTPEEQAVAEQIRPLTDMVAAGIGLKRGAGYMENYFPRIWDKKSMKAELPEEIAIRIAEEEMPAGTTYNPFKLKRSGAEGYKLDTWTALEAMARRYVRTKYLDPVLTNIRADTEKLTDASQIKFIKDFIDRVNFRPTDSDVKADNLLKRMFGDKVGPRPVHTITRKLRSAISRGAFWFNPATALRNLTQGVNTYAVLGERYTLQGYATLAKKLATGDLAELESSGIIEMGVVQDRTKTALSSFMQKADEAGFSFMRWTEFINRAPAYYGAKAKALDGKVEGIAKGDTKAAIEYAKDVVEDTQFRFDELGTPVGMASDVMKTLTQFQPFTVKQAAFLGKMIKNRDAVGLARYTIGSWIILATIGKAIGLDYKSFLPGFRILEEGKYMPPALQLPWAILAATLSNKDKYGNVIEGGPGERILRSKDVARSALLFIPGGVQLNKMLQAEKMAKTGGVRSTSGKTFYYGTPEDGDLLDWMIAYTLGPGYTKKGKAYWDKQNKVGPSFWTRILGTNKQAPADTFPGLGELPEMPGLPGLEELPEMPALPPLP